MAKLKHPPVRPPRKPPGTPPGKEPEAVALAVLDMVHVREKALTAAIHSICKAASPAGWQMQEWFPNGKTAPDFRAGLKFTRPDEPGDTMLFDATPMNEVPGRVKYGDTIGRNTGQLTGELPLAESGAEFWSTVDDFAKLYERAPVAEAPECIRWLPTVAPFA